MSPAVISRTFLAADVVAFSRLTERLGDQLCLRLMRRVERIVSLCSGSHRGESLEVRGDLFLLAFPAPPAAFLCALEMQHALDAYAALRNSDPVRLRVALHMGDVLDDGLRYFGKTLIVTFRLLDEAGSDEIVISRAAATWAGMRDLTQLSRETTFRPRGLSYDVKYLRIRRPYVIDPVSFENRELQPEEP